MFNVLVICTGNSCRSIIGEALFNHLGKGRVKAFSAGSHPKGKINPNAVATLENHGISTAGLCSKALDAISGRHIDIVINVCDQAAGEPCPVFLNKAIRVLWSLPDPAEATGTDEEIRDAFERTYNALETRINSMLELPLKVLSEHELIMELNKIGNMNI